MNLKRTTKKKNVWAVSCTGICFFVSACCFKGGVFLFPFLVSFAVLLCAFVWDQQQCSTVFGESTVEDELMLAPPSVSSSSCFALFFVGSV